MAYLILTKYIFPFNYLINRIQKKVSKNNSKKLKHSRQSLKTCFRFQAWVCQDFSSEVLSAWFEFQAKSPTRSGVCIQGEWQKYTRLSPSLSNDEELKDIGHSMSIGNLIFGVNSVTVSQFHIWFVITKCVKFFVTNCDSFINKCGSC